MSKSLSLLASIVALNDTSLSLLLLSKSSHDGAVVSGSESQIMSLLLSIFFLS
jgi:hypothetical protein